MNGGGNSGNDGAGRVALIGGRGFIGRSLAPRLRQPVRIVDADGTPGGGFAVADIRDRDGLTAALQGCAEIVHLAAAHRDDIPAGEYFDVNVRGTENVCAAASALGIARIVFASSAAVYGLRADAPDESMPPSPIGPYGESKRQAEDVLRRWQAEAPARRELVIVRPSAVFGAGNRANIHRVIAQFAQRGALMIGPGTNRKSVAFVENIAAFLAFLLERPLAAGCEIYNYADKPDLTMNEFRETVLRSLGRDTRAPLRLPLGAGLAAGALFDLAGRLTGRKFAVSRARIRKFGADSVIACGRARQAGFVPPFTLREALAATVVAEFGARGPSMPSGRR